MRVTCICVCHNKPDLAREAIDSVLRQSHADWQLLIIDSGVLFDAGYYDQCAWRTDPRIRLIRSHETEEIRHSRAMAPWCFNEAFRKGWVNGDLVVYLCDDDLFYPNAFETFVAFAKAHPEAGAMHASQDLGVIYPNGWHAIIGERRALEMGGQFCNGRRMDCEVDYLQFCHRPEILNRFPDDEYWPEAENTEEHADGIFIERIGKLTPIHPIDVKVSQNRRTTQSLNIPFSPVDFMDGLMNGIPVLPGIAARPSEFAAKRSRIEGAGKPLVTISLSKDANSAAVIDSISKQSYPAIEVLVANEAETHTSVLKRANGSYFLPLESNYLLMPHAIERLVARMTSNKRLAAVACYSLDHRADSHADLASVKNIGGHALYRVSDLRNLADADSVGTPDWSIFFRLINSGKLVDIVPEHLFWRSTDTRCSAEKLNRFVVMDRALAAERDILWSTMAGYEQRLGEMVIANKQLEARLQLLRYRIANRVHSLLLQVPGVVRALKWCITRMGRLFAGKSTTVAPTQVELPRLSAAKKASASL